MDLLQLVQAAAQTDLPAFMTLAAILGILPAIIAHAKGRAFLPWWFFGTVLFVLALPLSLLIKRPAPPPPANPPRPETVPTGSGGSNKRARASAPRSYRELRSKVVGVTKRNDDGSDRQRLIARCLSGDRLELRPEHDNPYDEYAVAVCRADGAQIGYLGSHLSEEIWKKIVRDGLDVRVKITNLTGGGRKTVGVNILILIPE